jgi:hypothetical protein
VRVIALFNAVPRAGHAPRWLFWTHGWIARWGAVAAVAGSSVIAGLCMVALFITPVGVRELTTSQLLGMAGLFMLPMATLAALHWERTNRSLGTSPSDGPPATTFTSVNLDDHPARDITPTAPDQAPEPGDAEEAQLSAEFDRVYPWHAPDPAALRPSDAQRHRRRMRASSAEHREFFGTGRE